MLNRNEGPIARGRSRAHRGGCALHRAAGERASRSSSRRWRTRRAQARRSASRRADRLMPARRASNARAAAFALGAVDRPTLSSRSELALRQRASSASRPSPRSSSALGDSRQRVAGSLLPPDGSTALAGGASERRTTHRRRAGALAAARRSWLASARGAADADERATDRAPARVRSPPPGAAGIDARHGCERSRGRRESRALGPACSIPLPLVDAAWHARGAARVRACRAAERRTRGARSARGDAERVDSAISKRRAGGARRRAAREPPARGPLSRLGAGHAARPDSSALRGDARRAGEAGARAHRAARRRRAPARRPARRGVALAGATGTTSRARRARRRGARRPIRSIQGRGSGADRARRRRHPAPRWRDGARFAAPPGPGVAVPEAAVCVATPALRGLRRGLARRLRRRSVTLEAPRHGGWLGERRPRRGRARGRARRPGSCSRAERGGAPPAD